MRSAAKDEIRTMFAVAVMFVAALAVAFVLVWVLTALSILLPRFDAGVLVGQ